MSPGIPTRLLATQSDDRLLALVRQGHERAFEAIVHRYRKPLLGYCRRLRLEDARAEDIVQLALLKTWIAVREGSEVRDLKAWLYRVVHNTAVNALRDSVHDGQPLPDPTQGASFDSRTDDSQLERGMAMREALAEVAALPPLQREVIVRTAVAGDSHEQVASDLGITNGAVRGLLYRARVTLRTGLTALTPPPLLGWLAGRSDQGGPGPERLAELAGGGGAAVGVGGAAGVSGLLLKGGAVALTVGTVVTGAAVVHLTASAPHRRHGLIASAASPSGAGGGSTRTESRSAARYGELSATAAGAGARRGASGRRDGRGAGSARGKTRGTPDATGGGGSARTPAGSGGDHAPTSRTRATGDTHANAPAKAPAGQSPAPGSTQGSSQAAGGSGAGSGAGSGQSGGSGESGSGSPGPVGSAAGNGSPSGSGTSGSSGSTSGGASEGGGSGSGQSGSGAGSGSESGTGSSEGSGSGGSSGGSSGSSGSESSGSEQSGSLVGTVVHEVGSILEHLLH
jgi:RNA polymerase sigma factor (sigma-70 family)